ncbi:S8 family serine peptidase [Photobacterium sp. SDRW27]|uniref:S8 family serine peptidase n=1 Tax=Photobacterium obscurum TaxID=2829490 RepID=UPI00224368E9|nr:S8 family serine peptidase [Photobacterium obscurum]MCW8328526.1 S8 family serine peptidase [Photobacterium obscurum]
MSRFLLQQPINLRSVLCFFALITPFTLNAEPNFHAGQVVVQATPDELGDAKVLRFYPNSGISVIQVELGKEASKLNAYRAKGKRASKNFIASHFANDPYYSTYQWHFSKIEVENAWEVSDGYGVTVAVLDTGLRMGGNDGIGCVEGGTDIAYDDNDPTDGDGHGTHVSGTIAQATNNSTGVAGLAYSSCVMPVKVLDDGGSGSFADIADGIYYAVSNGAGVINMSLGVSARSGLTNDPIMDAALDHAAANGVVVVAAAGNDSFRKNVSYPAIYPSVIAVGATDYNNALAPYSNRGKGLDIVAPGGNTAADENGDGFADGVLQETFASDGTWGYYFFQGTSMATPHVSALAAMLLANGIEPEDVKEAMTSTAQDLGNPGYDNSFGHGLIQPSQALNWSAGGSLPEEGGGENEVVCTDNDGDGYCAEVDDCDDTNANVNPGKNEKGQRRKDGLDNNCNGVIDA